MVRAKAMKKDTVNHWFQQCVKPVLIGLNLVDKQSQILETKTILSKHGQMSQQALPGGSGRENIRVQMCISATGKLIPPLLSIKKNNVAYF